MKSNINALLLLGALHSAIQAAEDAHYIATQRLVVGPNLKDRNGPVKWSVREVDQRGALALPVQVAALKDVSIVRADADEDASGCTHRASGLFCALSDVPKGLVPVKFHPGFGEFRVNERFVNLSHIVFLDNGDTLGIVKQ
jgi:hypothetical protein